MMDICYEDAAPIRTSPCLAWVVEFENKALNDDTLIFLSGPEVTAPDVIEMIKRHQAIAEDERFTVQNVTVGTYSVSRAVSDLYFNDARKVDSEGMIQL